MRVGQRAARPSPVGEAEGAAAAHVYCNGSRRPIRAAGVCRAELLLNGAEIDNVPEDDARQLAPVLDDGCRYEARIAEVRTTARGPIPMVQARVFGSVDPALDSVAAQRRSWRPATPSRLRAATRDRHRTGDCAGDHAMRRIALVARRTVVELSIPRQSRGCKLSKFEGPEPAGPNDLFAKVHWPARQSAMLLHHGRGKKKRNRCRRTPGVRNGRNAGPTRQ